MGLFVMRGVLSKRWRWPSLLLVDVPCVLLGLLAAAEGYWQLALFFAGVAAVWSWIVYWVTDPHPMVEQMAALQPGAPVRVEMQSTAKNPFGVRDRMLSVQGGVLRLADTETGVVDVEVPANQVTVGGGGAKLGRLDWPGGGCWVTPYGGSANLRTGKWAAMLTNHIQQMLDVDAAAQAHRAAAAQVPVVPMSSPATHTAASATPPAGWFPDPSGSAQQRWWDGQRWTEHVAP